jgi:hypothetical protein
VRTFRGVIYSAPAFVLPKAPPRPVVALLRCLCCCCPRRALPQDAAEIARIEAASWGGDERGARIAAGVRADPLRYTQPLRMGTALAAAGFAQRAVDAFAAVRYPFLLLHDPQDTITSAAGSRQLLAAAATPAAEKRLHEAVGQYHDLLCGRDVAGTHALIAEWLLAHAQPAQD